MIRRFATVAVLAASAALAGCGSPSPSPTLAPATWNGAIIQDPTTKPNVALVDTAGHPVNIATDTQGRVTLVYFGYTNCPDRCPADMAAVANSLKMLSTGERAHISVYFVTTDPARDTPAALRTFLDRFNPSFIGLTGSAADLLKAQRSAGVTLAVPATPSPGHTDYEVDHAAYVLAYGSDGRAHEAFPGGVSVDREAADLRRLVAGQTPA